MLRRPVNRPRDQSESCVSATDGPSAAHCCGIGTSALTQHACMRQPFRRPAYCTGQKHAARGRIVILLLAATLDRLDGKISEPWTVQDCLVDEERGPSLALFRFNLTNGDAEACRRDNWAITDSRSPRLALD